MNKKIIKVLVIIVILPVFLLSFNIIGFHKYYFGANKPNLKDGSTLFWTKLRNPKRLDFILFIAENESFGKFKNPSRLVGLPNDVIEIRLGDLYVNNLLIDKDLELRRLYKCDENYFYKNVEAITQENKSYYNFKMNNVDSVKITIDEFMVNKHDLELSRMIMHKHEIINFFKEKYNKDWNFDNFGPLKIPENKYFVLGDNRTDWLLDSRGLGLIDEEDILGTIIYSSK